MNPPVKSVGGMAIQKDVAALEADGFFEPADPPVKDDEEFEAELNERFSGPCNTLVLSVASGCNLACRYCYCGVCRDELPNKGLMDEETALLAVERLFAAIGAGIGSVLPVIALPALIVGGIVLVVWLIRRTYFS